MGVYGAGVLVVPPTGRPPPLIEETGATVLGAEGLEMADALVGRGRVEGTETELAPQTVVETTTVCVTTVVEVAVV